MTTGFGEPPVPTFERPEWKAWAKKNLELIHDHVERLHLEPSKKRKILLELARAQMDHYTGDVLSMDSAKVEGTMRDAINHIRYDARGPQGFLSTKHYKIFDAFVTALRYEWRARVLNGKSADTATNSVADPAATEHNTFLKSCKDEYLRRTGKRLTTKMIMQKTVWKDPTPIYRWQKHDERSTSGDDTRIRRALAEIMQTTK
jgi:hypothetical protein